jgi:glycosyltransferase involved in cell wall biosynthesis
VCHIANDVSVYYLFKTRRRVRAARVFRDVAARIREIILAEKPDVINAVYTTPYGWFANFSGFQPYVVTAMNSDVYGFSVMTRREKFLTLNALAGAKGIISVSDDIFNRIRKFGIDNNNHNVIWVGAQTKEFRPRKIPSAFIERFKIRYAQHLVFSPRAFHKLYRIDEIIRAIPLVLREYPSAVFVFASYRLNTDQYERNLRRLVRKLKISESVRFVGSMNRTEMSLMFNCARCFISIPVTDGTPASLHEGMACGCLPIVGDLPTTRKWVSHGKNGYVLKKISPEAIASAIIKTFELSPQRLRRIQRENREFVRRKADFNRERTREEIFYRKIIIRHRGLIGRDG